MCGITGGYRRPSISPKALDDALAAIRHRGPDDSGTYTDGPAFLGNVRLSIIDVAGGHQPVFNEDRTVAVVFNGEIYNYRELVSDLVMRGHSFTTRSDTETLVHLWEEEGVDMCGRLRGMFAFAIWDSRKKCLYMARDRLGKKPLYYCRDKEGCLLFASELKALRPLALSSGVRFHIRLQSIYDYLSLGVVPQPATIYEETKSLPPASWLLLQNGALSIQRYWELSYEPRKNISYKEAVENVRNLVSEAVRMRLRSDVPLGIFLSGGIDSSVVVYEAAQHLGESLLTFSIAFSDPKLDETSISTNTASALQVRNLAFPLTLHIEKDFERIISLFDQPYSDSSAIPTLRISELSREFVKVVLTGDGGDELFGGYRRHLAAHCLGLTAGIPTSMVRALSRLLSTFSLTRRSPMGFLARFARSVVGNAGQRYLVLTNDMLFEQDKRAAWLRPFPSPTENWIDALMLQHMKGLRLQMDADLKINLLSDLLVKMDICTMAASLEARSPLLDHVLAEYVATLPPQFLLNGFRTKALVRDAYRGLLPDEVVKGPKKGFEIPLASLLRNALHPMTMDTLGSNQSEVGDYVDRGFLQNILAEKTMSERNWAYIVYALLVLEFWLRKEKAA